jgi:hypothetical protein
MLFSGSPTQAAAKDTAALPPPPDIQIQQDHVLTNDDLLADPPLSRGFNLKPHVATPLSRGLLQHLAPDVKDVLIEWTSEA